MKTALVILAAGIGARYGGGIKQLEPVGPMGEIIMDYSIHDAIAAGFDKIVFIIRRDIEADFRQVIGDRIRGDLPPAGGRGGLCLPGAGGCAKGREGSDWAEKALGNRTGAFGLPGGTP